ncbi:ankyrin repeat domain-containing protein [Aromatoleum evansii]|uniref:ankyrin repeat domain-containing protein n=1 Tax=Aromatoleum evansii TaxID=59406 RepID=UPI00145CB649|nr:ankyrin repeat domain-containing protein [Aromatoleum evansii]NMG29942.1 ankyrin repeat domain-containing protein [Aromatoleum evansii]
MNDDVHHEAWGDRVGPELLDAVRHGNVPEVLRRLEEGLPSDWQDTEGCSLVFLAAFHRRWDIVDALLAHGASIDLPDRRGWTPLFWAAFNGHADIVSFLIGRGADPDLRTEDGEWPLFWAVYKGHTAVVRNLLIGGARRDLLDEEGHDMLWLARTLKRRDIIAMLERR